MKVTLITHTPDPEKVIAAAAKLCYSSSSVEDLMNGLTDEKVQSFIDMLMGLGHESPIEHCSFTFAIEGISRACYDKDTMVLTDKGWKMFKDVDIENDLFCSMDDSRNIEYVKAVDKIEYNYDGLMDVYKSSQIDLVVTPNHSMWVYDHEKRSPATKTWKFMQSDELVNCRYGFDKSSSGINTEHKNSIKIPSVCRNRHKPSLGHKYIGGDVNLFLELLGIWVTDGCLSYGTVRDGATVTGNRIQISQIKKFGRDRIKYLLDKLNIHYRMSPVAFLISDQSLFDWLAKNFINGKDTHKTYYLRLPRWMFTELSPNNIRSFIKGVFIGNGSHHAYTHKYLLDNNLSIFETGPGFNIYTGSEAFANDLVEISLLAGLCGNKRFVKPRYRTFPNGRKVLCRQQFVVSILNSGYHIFKTEPNKYKSYYKDKVYCVELEKYHKLYVMRNGRACWCGNCSHQLVRHRIASYSQKSQRYVNETQFEYVIPEAIANDPVSKDVYEETMELLQGRYDFIRAGLINNYVKNGMDKKAAEKKANEDARMILPNACCTSIIVTMNIRSLFNFFKHRCCNRAQWEIRDVANEMHRICMEIAPNIFKYSGPDCITKGKCSEGKMTCGKRPDIAYEVDNRFEKNLDGSVDGLLKYHGAIAGTDETNE